MGRNDYRTPALLFVLAAILPLILFTPSNAARNGVRLAFAAYTIDGERTAGLWDDHDGLTISVPSGTTIRFEMIGETANGHDTRECMNLIVVNQGQDSSYAQDSNDPDHAFYLTCRSNVELLVLGDVDSGNGTTSRERVTGYIVVG